MKTFRVILPDQSQGEYQISETSSVQEFIKIIREQNINKDWSTQELQLFLNTQLLKLDESVNKIIFNLETDTLTLKVKRREVQKKFQTLIQKNETNMDELKKALKKSSTVQTLEENPKSTEKAKIGKLLSFWVDATHKIVQVSRLKSQHFAEKVQQNEKWNLISTQKIEASGDEFKEPLKKSSTVQEIPKTTEKAKINKLLSFWVDATHKIVEVSRLKSQHFAEKVQQNEKGKHLTTSQDPSIIKQEDDHLKNNNDTVIGLLGDLQINTNKNSGRKDNETTKKISPAARKFLERKQKAIAILKDPTQQEKAKKLIAELNRQRKELEDRKNKQKHNESDQLEESIEKYKLDREQQQEYTNQEKRNKIMESLERMKQRFQQQKQKIQEQKKLINLLQNIEKERIKKIEAREEFIIKQKYQESKVKLQIKKKLAVPIRLEEINKHEENYLNQKQLLKLEKQQTQLENEIQIQQDTKQNYKAKKILQKVIDSDQKFKNQQIVEKQKQFEKLLRQQKYAELVKEYHRPNIKLKTDHQVIKADNSIQKYPEFLKEGEGKQSPRKVDSNRYKLYRQAQLGSERNVHQIQNVLNLYHVHKTKVTEQLLKGFVPNPSVYYQPRPMKSEASFEELQKKKPINYLKELKKERINQQGKLGQLNSNSLPRLHYDYRSILEKGKQLEKEAQQKEHQAYYLNDEKLKEEADDLFLRSVQEKIKFLEKI